MTTAQHGKIAVDKLFDYLAGIMDFYWERVKSYTPEEWREKGFNPPKATVLVLNFEESAMHAVLNYGEPSWTVQERFFNALKAAGYWYEQENGCITYIYRLPGQNKPLPVARLRRK